MSHELHIALTTGFEDDQVELRLDGAPIYIRPDVSTSPQLGIADSIEVTLSGPDPATVTVLVPTRSLVTSILVPAAVRRQHLGISVERGRLFGRFSDLPLGYR